MNIYHVRICWRSSAACANPVHSLLLAVSLLRGCASPLSGYVNVKILLTVSSVKMNLVKCMGAVFLVLCASMQEAQSKLKVLVLMPYNGKSHFLFAEVLFEELAKRGHDVTVVSQFPRKTPMPNYRDISVADNMADGVHVVSMEEKQLLGGLVWVFENGLNRVCRGSLSHPDVQKLLKSQERYDVIIAEMFNADCFLGFVHKFRAPLVFIRTSAVSTWLSGRTGNPDNPSYVPVTVGGTASRMSFLQRLKNAANYVLYKSLYMLYDYRCEQVARQHFGPDMPALQDIARNASLYLVNTHFAHQYAKPLVPNLKEIAGMHVRKPKPLSGDLENWISAAQHGVVYMNLGSMLRPSSMSAEKRRAFLDAFAGLKQRVIMKWDSTDAKDVPENVKLTTWAPQNDILHHPNVKLFISHAGMLGTVEAVHAGVPMIAIPFFGDQPTNAALLEERGLAVRLLYDDITFETVSNALHKILDDPGFAKRVKEISAAFHDRPMQPLDEAVYWIEYVARHHGTAAANLTRTPVLDLPLHQYLLLDVVLVVISALVVAAMILRKLVRLIINLTQDPQKKTNTKQKKS